MNEDNPSLSPEEVPPEDILIRVVAGIDVCLHGDDDDPNVAVGISAPEEKFDILLLQPGIELLMQLFARNCPEGFEMGLDALREGVMEARIVKIPEREEEMNMNRPYDDEDVLEEEEPSMICFLDINEQPIWFDVYMIAGVRCGGGFDGKNTAELLVEGLWHTVMDENQNAAQIVDKAKRCGR